MFIYVPPFFSQHPIVVDPPIWYVNNPQQQQTYNIAQQKIADCGDHPDKIIDANVARIGHNMMVAGINYMPFSIVEHPADVVKPYSYWPGFECLIAISNSQVQCERFKIGFDPQAPVMRSINLWCAW